MIDKKNIMGAIIAGGQATRMNKENKALKSLANKPLAEQIAQRLAPQVSELIINANRDEDEFLAIGNRVMGTDIAIVPDDAKLGAGPLAGLLQSLLHLENSHQSHLATVAGDTPFFPQDLVMRLSQAAPDEQTIMIAKSGGFPQPIFGLWPASLAQNLREWLLAGNSNKVMAWVRNHRHQLVEFEATEESNPFFNINAPEDLAIAEQMIAKDIA